MKDFIITSLQTWDIEIGSTIKNTALEISKQNRVLYINTPMDYSTRLKGNKQAPSYIRRMSVIKGEASPLRQVNKTCGTGLPVHTFVRKLSTRSLVQLLQQTEQPPYRPVDCAASCTTRF